jgi:PAS domain S-box-containing protein
VLKTHGKASQWHPFCLDGGCKKLIYYHLNSLNNGEFSFSNENLQQDFQLLTRALDASISGIIITDNRQPDNPIIYANLAFLEMTGYSRDEVIGHNCRFLQKEDREQPERKIIKEAVVHGESCQVRIRNYRKDGTAFWNELYMSPVKNNDGELTYFIGVQNDVTRRTHAEEELKRYQEIMKSQIDQRTKSLVDSEEYLNSIIQTVRESLIVLDVDFKVLSVNEHFLKTFRVTRGESEGRILFDLGNGQWDIQALKELLNTILPTSNPVEDFEVEHEFPNIGKKLMLLNAHRIELEGQYKDRILIAIEDITSRREIEQRKDDFLSIASHELKTPLTTVKGYIHMLNRYMPENAEERYRVLVEKTAAYVTRLNNLITELLDVSRIQTGNIELHKAAFDFDRMLTDTVEGLQAATKSHQITIEGRAGTLILGDESHLIQVMNNLLSNAIKYSPESNQILVYVNQVSDYLKVSVTDYGMGIKKEDQSKIFDRFYRVSEIQQRFPGMGIGLYVCDQIIKNHGGTLWVESEEGKGSTFSFTLPLVNKEENGQ